MRLLTTTTTTRQTRIDNAHARHDLNTAGTWRATADGIEPPIHRQTPEQLYQTADKAVFFAIRAREATSATNLFRELSQSAPTDRQRREITRIAEEISDHQRQHSRARAEIEALTRIIDSTKTAPAERLDAWKRREQAKQTAKKALERVQSLEQRINDTTTSDREQLVQVAIIAGLDPENATDPDRAFKRMTNSAGREISNLASPDALRSTRTKLTPITAEEAQAEREAHPDIITIDPLTGEEITTPAHVPFNVKGGQSAGYYTIEYRPATKTRPAGWYKVSHYATVAPYVSFETFATGENAEPIAKNGGINAIETISDREELEALINRANLTEREREIVLKLCDQTAKRHAEQAHHEAIEAGREAIAKADKAHRAQERQRAERRAERAYNTALWDSAFTRAGIYAQSTRSKTQTRIIEQMRKARSTAEPLTPAEEAERAQKRTARDMTRKPQGGRATTEARADLIAWTATDPGRACKPVIRWHDLTETPQTLTPAEIEAGQTRARAERTAQIEAHRADIARAQFRQEQIARPRQRGTAFPALDAQWIALRMWDRMTPAEQDKTIAQAQAEAEARAELERITERTARAERAQRDRAQITVKAFNAQTPEERKAFLCACNFYFDILK